MGGKQSKAKAAAQGKSTPSPNKAAASPSTTAPVAAPPPVPTPARPAASLTSSPDASATASRSTTPFAPCLHEYKQFCETLLTAYEDVAEACFQDRPDWSAVKWAAFRLDCLLFESDSRRTQLANEPPCGVCTRRAATISNELDDLRELLELARSAAKLQDIYTVMSPPEEGSLSGVA